MAMVSVLRCGLFLTRNRVSQMAKACPQQRILSAISPGRQLHSFSSYSSSLMPSTRVYRSLFPSAEPLAPNKAISRHLSIDPVTIAVAGLKYLDWARKRIESHVKLLSSKPTHAYQPRTDEINTIFQKIKELQVQYPGDRVLTVYIRGEQGTGKTQLAREYGEIFYKRLQLGKKIVATIETKSKARFFRSYLRLGLHLKCPLNSTQLKDIATEVQVKLQHSPGWLLIVEEMTPEFTALLRESVTEDAHRRNNLHHGSSLLDSPEGGEFKFLPQPGSQEWGRGVVLVTTTDDRVIPHDNPCTDVFEMPPMTEEDASALLEKISGCSREEAEEIVNQKRIERIPVKVASAGIYMKNIKDISYEDNPLPLVPMYRGTAVISDNDDDVQTAKQLAQSDPTLDKVFRLLAFCPSEPLPISVIERYLGKHADLDTVRRCELLMRNLPEDAEDDYDKIERVFLLPATYKSFTNTFAKRGTDLSSEEKELVEKIVHSILQVYEEASHTSSTSSEWIKWMLFPHMKSFVDRFRGDLPRHQKLQLFVALSNSYIDIQKNPKNFLQQLIKDLNDEEDQTFNYLEPHEIAKLCATVGIVYRNLGDYQKSGQYLKKALEERKHLRDLDVADIHRELSATLFNLGDYMKSIDHLRSALTLYRETLEDDNPLVGETLSRLAYLNIKEGRWRKGEGYLKEAVNHLKRPQSNAVLAAHLLKAEENLASLYSELGDHDQAINMMELGVRHKYHQLALAKLTAAYYCNGDRMNSEKRFQKLEEEVNIPLEALQVLGSTVCDFGDIPLAERLCHMMTKLTAGKTEDAQLLLGKLYRLIGNWNEAQEILETTLRRGEAAYGPDHIYVGKVLGVLGKVYKDQGLLTRSVVTYERALEIHTKVYGSWHPHPEVAFVLGDLGRVVQRTGDRKRGTAMMEKALNMWNRSIEFSRAFKSEKTSVHAMYSQMLSNYGILLRDTERLDEAESSLVNALQLQEKILAENSLPRLKTIYRLGTVWDRQGKREKAQLMIKSVLDSLKVISPNHPYTAVVLTGMARCMGDTKATLGHLEQALEIRTKPDRHCLDIHTLIACCYRVRGETLRTQDPPHALRSFVQAIEVLGKLIEREQTEQSHVSSDSSIEVAVVTKWEERQKQNRTMLENIIADMAKNN